MNNKHQELIAEKVAELLRLGELDRDKGGWYVPYEGVWTGDQESWLIKTLQDTIDTVLEEERERIITELTRAIIKEFTFTMDSGAVVCKLGYAEGQKLIKIVKALDNTPPNKV